MTAATRRHVGRGISKKSRGSGSGRQGCRQVQAVRGAVCAGDRAGARAPAREHQQAAAAPAPVGNDFVVTPGDLAFILKQIKIAERHATTLTASNPCGTLLAQPGDSIPDGEQVPDVITSYGLRTVDGSCNNLKAATGVQAPAALRAVPRHTNPSFFGAANQVFPRLIRRSSGRRPEHRPGRAARTDVVQVQTGNGRRLRAARDEQPDRRPDQHQPRSRRGGRAPAAHADRRQGDRRPVHHGPGPGRRPARWRSVGCTPSHQTLFIPNITTDTGLSPPYNSLFTFFGQFFDHGVDQTEKSGGTVFIPLNADDPLRTVGPDGNRRHR